MKRPAGVAEFFELIVREEEKDRSRLLSCVGTHPYTPDRIKRLKKLISEIRINEKKGFR
ncbi:MAG: hypothetical protein MRK01_12915 [Candidatus Scalindua sp.]|nr:hypothetical protein [Candidatus Scalindua sp.]